MKQSIKIFKKIIKLISSYIVDIIMWVIICYITFLIFQYTPKNLINILFFILFIFVVYCIIWGIYDNKKKIEKISNLIEIESRYRPRIKKKISSIFKYLDEIRSYKRQVIGIRDFTPLVKRHRYIEPNEELIKAINKLEKNIINNITKNPKEETVDQALSEVSQIHKDVINKLNKVKIK